LFVFCHKTNKTRQNHLSGKEACQLAASGGNTVVEPPTFF